jgi:predicted nucleic acid-binding protein
MRLIDTNILVHSADKKSPKQERAKVVLSYYMGTGEAYVVLQSVIEMYSALTKCVDVNTARDAANMVLNASGFKKIQADSEAVSEALDIAAHKNLRRSDVFDALLVATAKRNGIFKVLTENPKHFEGFGIEVETLETATLSEDF